MVVAMKHLRFQLDVEKFEMDTDTSSIVNKVTSKNSFQFT